jgi:hypothetical protein
MSLFDRDRVSPSLTVFDPPCLLESFNSPLSRNGGQGGQSGRNLDLANLYGERHAVCRPSRQATSDCLADIVESLGFSSPLRDAAGNRWALRNKHAGFVEFQRNEKLHNPILAGLLRHYKRRSSQKVCRCGKLENGRLRNSIILHLLYRFGREQDIARVQTGSTAMLAAKASPGREPSYARA